MSERQVLSVQEIREFLRPIMVGLGDANLDELARASEQREFAAGEVICAEGEPGNAFFVVVSGRAEILKRFDDESERLLHIIGANEFFGEMAIVQGSVRAATVRAIEPTVVLEIGEEAFRRVLVRSPSLASRIVSHLTSRLRDADQDAIADLRRAKEELRRALRQLRRLDRTKSDFIRVQAHELRTPVAALLGYAQMLQTNDLVQEEEDLLMLVEGIVASTERLHRIFNSILDLSRIMGGDLEIHRSPVMIPVTFHGIVSEFSAALEERGIELVLDDMAGLPVCPADPEMVYKAFWHLVNNAIKYTPDGGKITVSASQVDVPELGPCVEVAVQDTGIGIDADDLELIFEKFYRKGELALHSSGTTTFKGGGPGLGLAIAQGIVVVHGGRIWAESPGYDEETCPGSRFVVQLPLQTKSGIAQEVG
jgi:signal transduction histidine kinase